MGGSLRDQISCKLKREYSSELSASVAGKEQGLWYYKCPSCKHWHLTSKAVYQPKPKKRKRRHRQPDRLTFKLELDTLIMLDATKYDGKL